MRFLPVAIPLAALMLFASPPTLAIDENAFATTPTTNNGQRWRIAYYEGGEYIDYQKILTETIHGLMALGWIEPAEIPRQDGEQTQPLWNWLVNGARSEYLEFLSDGHYTANWDDEMRIKTAEAVIGRLSDKRDVDLVIAMGTWAGKDLANNRHSTATMVLSTSDPLSAGIIKSVEDSGFEHVHATVDPHRYERQVRVFHDMVGFKRLGVAYEDSVSGRSYAAMVMLEELSAERNFRIVPCYTKSDISDTQLAESSVVDCFRRLVKAADAIYVTNQGGVTSSSVPTLASIANEHRIPTFSMAGSEEVKYGFLASLSQAGFKYVGVFHAETFAKVFNGARPNDLDQLFEEPPKIAFNLYTAELIGFDPPLLMLGAADEIFKEIAAPQ
jgi:ABC-type uncharacterized transport system substrate-binding protein